MALEVMFEIGAGPSQEEGEFGSFVMINNHIFDPGMAPDRTNEIYEFPHTAAAHSALMILESLGLIPELEDTWREDYERLRGNVPDKLGGIDGTVTTHTHLDHMGLLKLVAHYKPAYIPATGIKIAWAWQQTAGRTSNQNIDVHNHMALMPNTRGRVKFADGDFATMSRNIIPIRDRQVFRTGSLEIDPYLVDHSMLDAYSFYITDRDEGVTAAFTGDIKMRGRRPEKTHEFFDDLHRRGLDHLIMESSLLHFDHRGDENDVREIFVRELRGRDHMTTDTPPRDFDRVTSVYEACKELGIMFLVPPAMAFSLDVLNGAFGIPKMTDKNMGVIFPRKRRGILGNEEFPRDLQFKDYNRMERFLLHRYNDWKGSHERKRQVVSLSEYARHQDRFLVYLPYAWMPAFYSEVNPNPNGNNVHLSSVPEGWTEDMALTAQRVVGLQVRYGINKPRDIQRIDFLNPEKHSTQPRAHVPGHFNRGEVREILGRFRGTNTNIWVYHAADPFYFESDVAQGLNLHIPVRRQRYILDAT